MARLGYVLRPLTLATSAMVAGAAFALLLDTTKSVAPAASAVALWGLGVMFFIWGVKEFIVPSRWRRHPRWIVESERRYLK